MSKINDYLDQYKEEILAQRKAGAQIKEIASKYNVSNSSMARFVSKYMPSNKHMHGYSEELQNEIVELYRDGWKIYDIAIKERITESTISRIIKEHGVHVRTPDQHARKYTLDHHYFDNIDTENKAYILGLLYADGCIQPERNFVTISLQESDVEVLRGLQSELKTDKPLSYLELSKKKSTFRNQYMFCLNSKYMAPVLVSKGLVPNKDFKLQFPTSDIVPNEFIPDFLRGYMDGDGSIAKRECRCSITGNIDIIQSMSDYLQETLGIHSSVYIPHKDHITATRCLTIAGRNQVKKYLDYIYRDGNCGLHIPRKYQQYIDQYKNYKAA